MKKLLFLFSFFTVLSLFLFVTVNHSSADEKKLNELYTQINELTAKLNDSVKATRPLESQLTSMKKQIADIKAGVAAIEADIEVKKKHIDDSYKNLDKQQKQLNYSIRNYYINSYSNSPLLAILSANSASEMTQILAYQQALADQDKQIITNLALSISDLEVKKENLELEQKRLTVLKTQLDEQSSKLDKVVAGAKTYQASLSSQIAQLSAQQQQLLAQKLGSLNIPKSAYTSQGGCVDDRNIDPGFSPRLAFFSYGVPHRVGLNQYGAKGRAEAGQNAETILKAYFNADYTTGYNTGITIHVSGTNEYGQSFDDRWNIEEYLKHVYEVPSAWPKEVLKAQAIAARSYALRRTDNGANSICPSQSCQVVKREENADSWKQAVSETAGIVMTSGGTPISAWYSSTHGGYVFASASDISGAAWTKNAKDTTTDSINSFSDLQNNAYDKASPWFYCDWGSRAQYNKTAWMKPEEVADIANVILLVRKDSSTGCFVYQPDKTPPAADPSKGCPKTDNWSADKVKSELKARNINPFNSIADSSVNADFGSGTLTSITLSGDGKSESFSGSEFKNWFNVRAPANLQIVSQLYNVEKR